MKPEALEPGLTEARGERLLLAGNGFPPQSPQADFDRQGIAPKVSFLPGLVLTRRQFPAFAGPARAVPDDR
jgi:hypothetical protein